MSNFDHLLDLRTNVFIDGDELQNRLSRLICGYYGTQFFFARMIKETECVADVGCYFGQWSYPLLEKAKKVYFVDHRADKFPYLSQLCAAASNAEFVTHNFEDGPLSNAQESFDLVLCMDCLHYIRLDRLAAFCKNMIRTIKPGGLLFFDNRDPQQLSAWYQFIVHLDPVLLYFYPNLASALGSSTSVKNRITAIPKAIFQSTSRNLFEFVRRSPFLTRSLLGREISSSSQKNSPFDRAREIFLAEGLKELSIEEYIDLDLYKMLRGIEGYNLTNTFVGNYFRFGLYKNPGSLLQT